MQCIWKFFLLIKYIIFYCIYTLATAKYRFIKFFFSLCYSVPKMIRNKIYDSRRNNTIGCGVIAVFIDWLIVVSFVTLAAVAVNRAVLLGATPTVYSKLYSPKRVYLSLIICWALGGVSLVQVKESNVVEVPYRICLSISSDGRDPNIDFIFTLATALPCVLVTLFSYFLVLRTTKHMKKNLIGKKNNRRNMAVTRNLIAVTSVYIICFLPNIIVTIVDAKLEIPNAVRHVSFILFMSHSIINPLLYFLLHKPLTLSILNMLRKGLKIQNKQIIPAIFLGKNQMNK